MELNYCMFLPPSRSPKNNSNHDGCVYYKPQGIGDDDGSFLVRSPIYNPRNIKQGVCRPRYKRKVGGIMVYINFCDLRNTDKGADNADKNNSAVKETFPCSACGIWFKSFA